MRAEFQAGDCGYSVIPGKNLSYRHDLDFIRGVEESQRVATWSAAVHSFVLLKPESIIESRLDQILQWLEWKGYVVTQIIEVQLTSQSLRDLWKYQWNLFPAARVPIMEALYLSRRLPLIWVKQEDLADVPCAIQLASDKGLGSGQGSSRSSLRSQLGQRNLLLNYVHTPDEPADVLREASILLPGGGLADAIHGAVQPSFDRVLPRGLSACSADRTGATSLSFESLSGVVVDWLRDNSGSQEITLGSEIRAVASRWISGDYDLGALEEVVARLNKAIDHLRLPEYVLPCLRSYLIPMENENVIPRFGRVSPALWRQSRLKH